jgi:osmotically-inducible protein OsmY
MTTKRSNKDLRKRVVDELDWEPSIDSADIGVAAKEGVVTLSGHVSSYAQKRTAERTVLRLSGVKGVANEIEVRLPSEHTRSDSDLAQAAIDALDRNIQIPAESVKVKVDDSWVTLEGVVNWDYQRKRAERTLRYLMGVKGVTNHLRVKERATPGDLRQRIKRALERRIDEESNRISVSVEGSTVTLSGTVPSWADHDDIEDAVWAAPGVTNVENKLKVSRTAYV